MGGFFAIFPGSVTNTFGLNIGPQVYAIVNFGSVIVDTLNLMMVDILLPYTSYVFCFYTCSVVTVGTLFILWRFREKLDVENLKKYNALNNLG